MVKTTLVGNYPRIGDAFEEQALRRAIARFDRGEATQADVHEAERKLTTEVLAEQAHAGIDVVTDGQVAWNDAASHIARRLAGIEVDGLVRYFDTNTYYRQPVVTGAVAWREPILVDSWRYAQDQAKAPVKAVLTGPATLAALAADRHYGKRNALAAALAQALAKEAAALAAAGVKHFQVDEPILAREPGALSLVAETLAPIAKAKGAAELTLAVTFGEVSKIYRDLLGLPADLLLLDLVQGAKTWSAIAKHGSEKPLVLGLIDARNTKLEDPKAVAAKVRELREKVDLGRSYLSPSNGLEFLPRARAREKLAVLSQAARLAGAGA